MAVVYESRLSLSSFWCTSHVGGGVETLASYLKRKLTGSLAVSTLKLEPRKNSGSWFIIRYGKGRQRQEVPVGVDSLVEKDTLNRVSFELGWIDPNDWDDSQIKWRLDTFEERKPVAVRTYVVVASRTAQKPLFSVTDDTANFTWVPLHALFPDLPPEAKFVGWKKAAADAKKLQLEKVDEAYMFERLFPPVYREYVRTLLHLPIAVGEKIVQTVDFRDAEPKAFEPLLLRSGTCNPDELFHGMVTFRVQIGVSLNGQLLALSRLPNRPVVTQFIELKRSKIKEGADIVPVETVISQPNWYASFPIVNTRECVRVNMATLDILDPIIRSNFVQRLIFPHSPINLPMSFINKIFTWRMKGVYTFANLFTVATKSKGGSKGQVYISLLKPWY